MLCFTTPKRACPPRSRIEYVYEEDEEDLENHEAEPEWNDMITLKGTKLERKDIQICE
jgi:hypothetical protein